MHFNFVSKYVGFAFQHISNKTFNIGTKLTIIIATVRASLLLHTSHHSYYTLTFKAEALCLISNVQLVKHTLLLYLMANIALP